MPRVKDDKKLDAIHEAALRLVIQTGFTGLKMADVAKAAGVATGTLYIYYPGKESLVNALFKSIKGEMVSLFQGISMDVYDYAALFRDLWMRYFSYCMENPEKMLFAEQFHYSGIVDPELIKMADEGMAALDRFLTIGQEHDLIIGGNIKVLKAHLQGSVHEIVRMFYQSRIKPGKETMEKCYLMAWNSIRR